MKPLISFCSIYNLHYGIAKIKPNRGYVRRFPEKRYSFTEKPRITPSGMVRPLQDPVRGLFAAVIREPTHPIEISPESLDIFTWVFLFVCLQQWVSFCCYQVACLWFNLTISFPAVVFDLPTLFPFPSLSTPTDKISIKRYHQDTSCCVSGLVLKWKICLLTTFYCNKMPDILLTRSVVTCKQRYCWLSELVIYLMLSFGFSPMIFCNQIQNKLARHLVLKKEILFFLFFFQLKSIKKKYIYLQI